MLKKTEEPIQINWHHWVHKTQDEDKQNRQNREQTRKEVCPRT